MLKTIIKLGVIVCITGCGIVDGGGDKPETSPTPSASIVPSVKPPAANPLCVGDLLGFGPKNNNLWKPVDNKGNVTFILDERFTAEFKECLVELRTGKFSALNCAKGDYNNYTCFANGNRQHWRGAITADKVKNKAIITCLEPQQECRFVLPGAASNRYE